MEFDHAAATRTIDDDIVQGKARKHDFVAAHDAAFKKDAVFDFKIAFDDSGERTGGILQRYIGDEPQPAVVDAYQWNLIWRQKAAGSEHGAVAAHDHGQVGGFSDLAIIGDGQIGNAGVFSSVGYYHYLAASCRQRGAQFAQWTVQAAVLVPANKRDGFKMHE